MATGDAELEEIQELEAEANDRNSGDVSALARRSVLNFAGGAAFGFFSFLWLVLVNRGWGPARAGVLFEAVAFFTIATGLVVLGSEESVLRAVSRARALGQVSATRRTLVVALVPVFCFAVAIAAIVWFAAPSIAQLFSQRDAVGDRDAMTTYVRVFAPALPFTALYFAVLAATRGYGTMVPTVAVERVGRTAAQVALAAVVIAIGLGVVAMGLAYTLPFVVGLVIGAAALARLIRRDDRVRETGEAPAFAQVASEYWRFSAFRGIASTFQVTSLWIDTLLVGALVSASWTAVYTTCSRTVRLGSIVLLALIQALAPQISDLLARGEHKRAQDVYRTSTWWTMTLTWPLYLLLAIFASVVLRLFGPGYSAGAEVVVTMSAAMLFSTATGPVDMILLMGGKSGWNLVNNVVSLAVDVVLILVLVPRIGIEGAAIAWAASVVLNNVLPWIEVRALLGISPFARPGVIPAIASLATFGVVGVAARAVIGDTLAGLVVGALLATPLYLLALRRFGDALDLRSLPAALRRRTAPATTG
jgi:O-antigen/teichoic acid export membrane protein